MPADPRNLTAAELIAETTFSTMAAHLEESRREGNFIQFRDLDEEELDALIVPLTYCPNVATLLDDSNWETLEKILEEASPNGADYQRHDFGHWATPYAFFTVRPGSEAHRAAEIAINSMADYPVLDEWDLSEREHNATLENIETELRNTTIERDGELVDDAEVASALFSWFWDHDQSAVECNDGGGGWPTSEQIEAGLIGLGYTDPGDGGAWQAPPLAPEPAAEHSHDPDVFCEVCCAPGAGCSFATHDTERAPAPDGLEECEDNACTGCEYCDANGITRG